MTIKWNWWYCTDGWLTNDVQAHCLWHLYSVGVCVCVCALCSIHILEKRPKIQTSNQRYFGRWMQSLLHFHTCDCHDDLLEINFKSIKSAHTHTYMHSDELVAYAQKSIHLSTIINILFKRRFIPQFILPILFSFFASALAHLQCSAMPVIFCFFSLSSFQLIEYVHFFVAVEYFLPFLLIYAHFWLQLIGFNRERERDWKKMFKAKMNGMQT